MAETEGACAPEVELPKGLDRIQRDLDNLDVKELDLAALVKYGKLLDTRLPGSGRGTAGTALIEKLVHVRTREGHSVRLKANAVQKAFEARRGQRNVVLKARQMGITTWVAARFFLKTITHPGTLTLQVAHTQEAAEEIFRIVHRFVSRLPESLRRGVLKTSRANARQIVFPELDSQYRVESAADRNAGRGLTVQNLHASELARWPGDPAETLAGLRAALTPDAEQVLESTPDGIGGCFYEEWKTAGETGLVRHFFPWWLEPHYRAGAVEEASLTAEERKLMEEAGLDREQIGFRRQLRASFRGQTAQEYAEDDESCFRSSGELVFEREAVEARLREAPNPYERRLNGALEIWLPLVRGKHYLVAVDPAGGGSEGDNSAIEVLDLETGQQCAEFAGHLGGLALAQLAVDLATEYNRAWLVVERNNHGSGVLAMVENVCHYERVYRHRGEAGWLTTSASRPAMLGCMQSALVEAPELFCSRALLGECRSFVHLANGRTGAQAGTHDDRVMAMAMGLAARRELLESGGKAGS